MKTQAPIKLRMPNVECRIKVVIALLASFVIGYSSFALPALTPFFQNFYNADGSPQTNVITLSAYPAQNIWTVVGTNTVYGGKTITLTPDTNGYIFASVSPNQYRLQFAGLEYSLYANIPNTTNVLPLATYIINTPVIAGAPLNSYALITNLLGYAPPLPTFAGITNALGYVPPANSYPALTNILGFIPATNGGPLAYSQLPWTTPTNSPGGITYALQYTPPTNTVAGITYALGYVPPTNTLSGLIYALGFQPATNPPLLITTNIAFIGPDNSTNTLYITNSAIQRLSTP